MIPKKLVITKKGGVPPALPAPPSKSASDKGAKVTEPYFWKKLLIWRYSRKGLQISPKSDTLIFFSKTALTIFLVFGLKLVLNMTFNLNETYFSEKFGIWRYLTSKSSENCQNYRKNIDIFSLSCFNIKVNKEVNTLLGLPNALSKARILSFLISRTFLLLLL